MGFPVTKVKNNEPNFIYMGYLVKIGERAVFFMRALFSLKRRKYFKKETRIKGLQSNCGPMLSML